MINDVLDSFEPDVGFYRLPLRVDVEQLQTETNLLTMNNSIAAFVHRQQVTRHVASFHLAMDRPNKCQGRRQYNENRPFIDHVT